MSSKKKRNHVGSGPGENIDIEDKINAAMDKLMKDPEEERNSSKRKSNRQTESLKQRIRIRRKI